MDNFMTQVKQFYEGLIGMNPDSISGYTWESSIKRRMAELSLKTPAEYWSLLQRSREEQSLFQEYLVVPETWFFRHRESYDYLKQLVHQEWVKQDRRKEPLRLLSIPCSTGEEPYSLSIALLEAGVPPGWFSIEAVDISQHCVTAAAQAIYSKNAFRSGSESCQRTYFTQTADGRFQVQPYIRQQVRVMQGNIVSGSFLIERRPYDIIFCRNLFIYLTPLAQEKARTNIDRLLTDDGLLFVSPVEAHVVRGWGYVNHGPFGACAFSKHSIKSAAPTIVNEVAPVKIDDNLNIKLGEVRGFADEGRFDQAAHLCSQCLMEGNTNAEAYFLMGIIEQARGNEYNAENALRRAIYLDPNHVEALVCLALHAERKGEMEEAQLLRQRASKGEGQ